jgi:uncharacterized damage-inducible protein DinB
MELKLTDTSASFTQVRQGYQILSTLSRGVATVGHMPIREMLLDTFVHMSPPAALDGLSEDDAFREPAPAVHHVAAILAHMDFWQSWFLDRCDGVATPVVSAAAAGWPAVAPGEWHRLLTRFRTGLERAAAIGDDAGRVDRPVTPPVDFAPLVGFTIRDALVHVAQHNSHHLGQIITTRQVLGCWPPPAGSWTW